MDLSAIGRQFGLNEEQTRAAMDALAPVVAAGVRRNAQSPQGLQDILGSVLNGNRGAVLDDENAVQFDNAKSSGDEILGQIFGSKDTSREVAQQLSATSGVGAAVLKKLLPIVASIVMGQVAKKMGGGTGASGGGLGDILGDVLGGGQQRQQPQSGGGGLGDILGDILGGGQKQSGGAGGGLGDILGDILGGGAQQQQPEVQQRQAPTGQGGSLEDILGEILNGGKGGVVVKQIPQDQMGDILRDILGGGAARQPTEEAVTRGRKTLDDVLGGGTRQGSDADILLDSVERSVRRR
jgi:hypothetical protein